MPQTEEEHLENESIEDDRSTKDPNDAEVISVWLLAILPKVVEDLTLSYLNSLTLYTA